MTPLLLCYSATLQLCTFATLLLLLAGCGELDFGTGPLLYDVSVAPNSITPNADGDEDVAEIKYSLRRTAEVSIYLENEAEERFYFREQRRRSVGDYAVYWGGVINQVQQIESGYGLQEIQGYVLPDGEYTLTVEAVEETGQRTFVETVVNLSESDTEVPELHNFAVVPEIFRPNQDGLRDDWVSISYYLNKEVDTIQVYLLDPAKPGVKFPIPEEPGVAKITDAGFHEYRYEGGVDLNAEPPPDGTYTIVGEARDLAGNTVRVSQQLTIEEGGKPRADVVHGEIDWLDETNRQVGVPLGEKLCFKTIVANEGTVPIRTSGPDSGQEYLFSENYNTLAGREDASWFQQAGVWRFAINYDTTGLDFPFRWSIGRAEDLEMRVIEGQEHWYLMPGHSGEVSGCIVMDAKPPVGTNFWWGGLIHEFVGVANNYIDRISVDVGVP